ncbi:hypothetical protein C7121_00875 [Paenibacillus glucanolyticus]|uniref:DUF4878 domain-containing protein n=1 Tax=Paenibacillus glucanolyticus TaxID=59843 RepID=A0A163KBC2_9BACL|nr:MULTISPECIES: hypothetical protein [Paenibacillus]ANA81079.1 hypothetical protein A3958_14340 [Paenibacillus glucanolyticus]AVV54802.1 hypothetical protein C7121_00875 [Paenibacillus glucanolyticus]ETT36352.1 hypothetical protein C169_13999 [Paenibacillus sp. FSL R5-808]KZS47115.1 hypothetical protein AWU65_14870 [Paenibacillus glucanolyticus]MDH6672702.1 hypothetical protein [Paenibacillus sp. LBL]
MNKLKQIMPLFLLLSLFLSTSIFATSANTVEKSNEALDVAHLYFKALLKNDVNGMIEYSNDLNYIDNKSREKGYNEFATDTLVSYEILKVENINDTEYQLQVQLTYTDVDNYPPLPYTVSKTEQGWKVIIKPLEVNLDPGSSDYLKVKAGTPIHKMIQEPETTIQPFAELVYYSFDLFGQQPLLGQTNFNISRGSVTVHGWQNDRIGTASVRYEIVKPLSGGNVNWYGQKTVNGNYPQNGTWYSESISLSASPITNARIRITNMSYDVFGAGNVYE